MNRTKLFGLLRNLLARPGLAPAPSQDAPAPLPFPPPSPASNPPAQRHYNADGAPHNSTGVPLPLEAILNELPLELHPRLRWRGVGGQTISIPLETILPQLARGAVKTSFGALRQSAPQVFSQETDGDNVQVTLPLGEILSRLNPAFILRRRSQRQVEVPEEISSPFGPRGQALAISPGPSGSGPLPEPLSVSMSQAPAISPDPSAPEQPPDPLPLIAPAAPRRPPGLLFPVPPPAPRSSLISMPSPGLRPCRLRPRPD